jgi:hypothetical protein
VRVLEHVLTSRNPNHARVVARFVGYFYDMLKPKDSETMTPAREMGAAFLGGLASGIPCSMWELTMIQQQVRHLADYAVDGGGGWWWW